MKRKPEPIDDLDDDLDEEAEARERYGDAYPEPLECTGPHVSKGGTSDTATEIPTINDQPSTNGEINYHYLPRLTDEHLPDLDYSRIDNLFVAKTANGWLRESERQQVQRPLFGEFWNEGELAILFADTGIGKSVLAMQIGESIASGLRIPPFKLGTKAQRREPGRVLRLHRLGQIGDYRVF